MWKKKAAATALALAMVVQSAVPTFALGGTNEGSRSAPAEMAETVESARIKENINKGWHFKYYGSVTETPTAETFDDSDWDTVNVPHTWNNLDGQDGGDNMARGNGWYRKELEWKSEYEGKQIFIEFLGASRDVTVYVNGEQAGDMHRGAYTAFRYDITELLQDGTNVIAVRTDNSYNTSVIPLSGDFNVYGGIYRDVSLVVADPVHVDLLDYGSNGLYLETGNVSETSGELTVRSTIVNDSDQTKTVKVTAVVKEGVDSFEEIDEITDPMFNVEDMLVNDKEPVATCTDTFTLEAKSEHEFSEDVTVQNPHLWNGLTDPFRYQVDLTVEVDGKVVDNVSDYVGFRYFEVDINTGFCLNGESYPLHGVSRHQDWEDMGCAISTAEHDVDFGMIYEIGANTIRLAHYPHDPYYYDLCDRYGMVVWAEIPFVNEVGAGTDFYEITERQLVELIRQQYNRPGICFWGLQNEVGNGGRPSTNMTTIMQNLDAKAKEEDTTGRLTTQATNGNSSWQSDLLAWNTYPGWYNGAISSFSSKISSLAPGSRPVGISEYGFGGNTQQHSFDVTKSQTITTTGQWHPEEYQNLGHEEAVKVFAEDGKKWVWASYIWNMFDFACDERNEGNNPGINDKGLVTYDRETKKDSFYIYKANWNQRDKFAHITSSRIDTDEFDSIPYVKVYSNCDSVDLYVDGELKGTMTDEGYGIFRWTDQNGDLPVEEGTIIRVAATDSGSGKTYTDEVTLESAPGSEAELKSDVLAIDNENKTIGLTGSIDISTLKEVLAGVRKATYYVIDKNGDQVLEGDITLEKEYQVAVTSGDGKTTAFYSFVSTYLSAGKKVVVSSAETNNPKENAVDGNSDTRWAAATGGGNQWIYVDLGEEYFLSKIRIDWFNSDNNKRSYQYTINVSNDAENWTTIIDRSDNSEQDSVTDEFPEGTTGRYVKISVASIKNSSGNIVTNVNASMYEIAINGWKMTSTAFDIDHTNKWIIVPDNYLLDGESLTLNTFPEGLEIKGDCDYGLIAPSQYIAAHGDSLRITYETGEVDEDGNYVKGTINYDIYCEESDPGSDLTYVTQITLSDSDNTDSISMETGQTKELDLELTPADAKRKAVVWKSSDTNVVTISKNGKLTAVGEGTAVITATNAYDSTVVSNGLTVNVSLSDSYILKGVLEDIEAALEDLHVTNETTKEDIMAAIEATAKAASEDITAEWKIDFRKEESTETEQGSITGQISLKLGNSFVLLNINKKISSIEEVIAILGDEKSNVQTATESISATNAMTEASILATITDAIANKNVTATWLSFQKTEATQTEDGRIQGVLQLTLDGKTEVLEINWTLAKTGSTSNTPSDNGTEEQNSIKEGLTYTVGDYTYKVTSLSAKTVEITGLLKEKTVTKIAVGDTVSLNGTAYKITSIGQGAFKNNKNITGVTVGKNVEKIGNSAFAGCVKLKKVTVKSTILKQIDKKTFYNCKALKNIILKSKSLKKVGKNVFKGIHKKAVIKVSKAKYQAYTKLLAKKGQSKTVRIKK